MSSQIFHFLKVNVLMGRLGIFDVEKFVVIFVPLFGGPEPFFDGP